MRSNTSSRARSSLTSRLVAAGRAILPGVLALAIVGCASPPPQPESMRDPAADFSAYRTWGWGPAAGLSGADEPLRLLDRNIRDSIATELRRRGYSESQDGADLLIYYETASADKVETNPVQVGVGIGSWGGNFGGSVNMSSPSLRNYREGRLVVHAVDTSRNAEVWQGSISSRISKSGIDAAAVQQAVSAALRDFPAR